MGNRLRKDIRTRLLLLYGGLSLVMTWPLACHLNSRILGDGDAWQFVWNMWWVREAVTTPTSPFHSDLIHHPIGADLYLHTVVWSAGLASVPFQWALSRLTLYNLIALATFVLAAWGMYRLARDLGLGRTGSAAAGLVFSFNPYHYCHALGHLNLLNYQWIPFFLSASLRAHRDGWPARGIVCSALWLALIGLTDWYYFLFSLLAAGLLLGFEAVRGAPALRLLRALAAPFLAFVLLSPLLVPALGLARQLPAADVTAKFSAPVEAFFIPGPVSTWAGPFSGWHESWTAGAAELGTFVPPSLLVLVIVGWRTLPVVARRLAALWLAVFVGLSLGPHLQAFGETLPGPLPFVWLTSAVPGLDIMRAPIRFHLMTLLALALLYGAALDRCGPLRRRRWLPAALGLLFVVETASVPLQTTAPEISPFWRQLAEQEPKEALIDLHYLSHVLHNQTFHRWKVAGRAGMLSRETPETLAFLETGGLAQLLDENRILMAHNGWPDRLPSALADSLPERFRMVAMGRLREGGEGTVRSALPHQVWTAAGPQVAGTATPVQAAPGDPLIVHMTLSGADLVSRPFSGPGLLAAVEPYQPLVGPEPGMTLLFYDLATGGEPAGEVLERLSGLGFRWIIVPYYGNDRYVSEWLALDPGYQDRWLKAYRIP